MKKILILFIFIGLGSLTAQTFLPKITRLQKQSVTYKEGIKDIKILAVMVDFQVDDFDLTYGDGKFGTIYSKDYGNDIIDPLPHNKSYFESHLEFAVNYFNKASNGIVNIEYSVLPEVYTVSNPMREYSPTGDESFERLGNFAKEVWSLVNNANPNFDFSQYNTFMIFHAGVGKDISTREIFGEARDLPSIYLSLNSLQKFYGQNFAGFEMNDATNITNTIILPETESREETTIGGKALIELSINGLIVSSIASRMGLPDLFDSETGKSAIGRFGLMDGQSLFAFGGLFPPEPSAWEKIFLGWEEPLVIDADSANIVITASEVAELEDTKIVKVPINSTEYFLIENRRRDANNDGVKIKYKVAGQIRTIKFDDDLDNFNNGSVDTLSGVILNVDEFDWALPGSGILIWHIDEKIIADNLDENRINVGKNRGVDLEEADGIQDIGEEFTTVFGNLVISEGDKFDFWYNGNTSKLYKNEFSSNTKPSSKTNSGANSLLSISNISDQANKMSFDVSFGDGNINLLNKIVLNEKVSSIKLSSTLNNNLAFASSENDIIEIKNNQTFKDFSNVNFTLYEDNNHAVLFGVFGDTLKIKDFENVNSLSISLDNTITSPLVFSKKSDDIIKIYLGSASGHLLIYEYSLSLGNAILSSSTEFTTTPISQIAVIDNYILVSSGMELNDSDGNKFDLSEAIEQISVSKNSDGSYTILAKSETSIFSISSLDNNLAQIFSSENTISNFSLADLKNDGGNYIVFTENNRVNVINLNGSVAEGFPFITKENFSFIGTPLIADINNDSYSDILATNTNGDVFAISGNSAKIINEFPLSIGGEFNGKQAIVKRENDLLLASVTTLGEIFLWSINSKGEVDWGNKYGNNANTSSLGVASNDNYITTYFPKDKTYNWPNPVYGDVTYIRTYVAEDSNIEVKIFDLAGDLVDELSFFAQGGLDTEYSWNVSNIQSGAYIARLKANSVNGKSENKIIKIAIIK